MVYGLIGEAWLVVQDQRHGILTRNVCSRNDDEFVPGNVRSELQAEYFAARDFTPHGNSVDHSREGEIVNIPCAAGHLVAPFFPWNRLADDRLAKHSAYYDACSGRDKGRKAPGRTCGSTLASPRALKQLYNAVRFRL